MRVLLSRKRVVGMHVVYWKNGGWCKARSRYVSAPAFVEQLSDFDITQYDEQGWTERELKQAFDDMWQGR